MRPDALWHILKNFRDSPLAFQVGLAILLCHLAMAVAGPYLAPYGYSQMRAGPPLSGASFQHWFGLDQLGRDVFSRAVHGAAPVLLISFAGTILGFVTGTAIGLISGLRGGLFDAIAMRICEAFISIPTLFLALLVVALAGVGRNDAIVLLILVIGFVYAPRIARMARSAAMEISVKDYVTAARLRGEAYWRIALRDVLPNIAGTMFVEFALRAAYAPVLVAALGFLGFGLEPPTPEWGLLIAENRNIIFLSPATVLGPGLLLASLVVGINLLTDGAAQRVGRPAVRTT